MELTKKLSLTGLLPVVKLRSPDLALPLAEALAAGGLTAAEITFRTDAAQESIRIISRQRPDFFIAAGTVLTPENADRAMDAGASLVVSPGLNAAVVEHCLKKGYPVIPGISTPSELEIALSYGLDTVKLFPAEVLGGVKLLKAFAGPYGAVKFMPTGGVDAKNLASYLALPNVLCCGGSWMVSEDPEVTRQRTRDAVDAMLGLRFLGAEGDRVTLAAPDTDRAGYYLERRGFERRASEGAAVYSNGAVTLEIVKEAAK